MNSPGSMVPGVHGARGAVAMFVHSHILEFLRGLGYLRNHLTQNNSYVQHLATLYVFLHLLRDLRQTFTERFVKLAVVYDFWEVFIAIGIALTICVLVQLYKES